jgi:hypothetical protein
VEELHISRIFSVFSSPSVAAIEGRGWNDSCRRTVDEIEARFG